MLWFADVDNIARGETAVAGPSADPADASNDPKDAAKWSKDRDIRASLIRWLAVDHAAAERIDPKGLRVLGARIVGPLDLAQVSVSFPIGLIECSISQVMNFSFADIPSLDLNGSNTAGLSGLSLNAHAFVSLGSDLRINSGGFRASGAVDLTLAKADSFFLQGGHFHFSAVPNSLLGNPTLKAALILFSVQSKGDVTLCCGFDSEGAVLVDESTIGGDLNCSGGRFSNPNTIALSASNASIAGDFIAGDHPYGFGGKGGFEADGVVFIPLARIGAVEIRHAKFGGKPREWHGLSAYGVSTRTTFVWQNVELENGAILDLSAANLGTFVDDEKSWPQPGKLFIDRLSYTGFGGLRASSPSDARSRLRWLGLQDGYYPQPYRQLARVLRENGDEAGAVQVLIAAGDARYSAHGLPGQLLGSLLKWTIGYGHRPLLALLWSLAVVLIGSMVVLIGKRAGVMRLTWPETTAPPPAETVTGLHPLLYSLDVFLPFVNLHQEHYWWPDEAASGRCNVAGRSLRVDGWMLRYYLWLQIIAGWLLSAIFIAGVTGLIHND